MINGMEFKRRWQPDFIKIPMLKSLSLCLLFWVMPSKGGMDAVLAVLGNAKQRWNGSSAHCCVENGFMNNVFMIRIYN